MNILGNKNKSLIIAITTCFVIIIGVDLPLITNSLKGKEKDFNDKLFFVVFSIEARILRDSLLMNSLTSDTALVRLVQTDIKSKIDSAFNENAIPTNYAVATGKLQNEEMMKLEVENLIRGRPGNYLFWSSMPESNKEIIATKVRIANLGPPGKKLYYVKIYFPHKQQFLLRSLIPQFVIMAVSLVMLFVCFLVLVSTVRTQNIIAKSKDDFISNITHELKTPLFTISIATKILGEQEVIKSQPKFLEYLKTIRNETTRLLHLTDKVLDTPGIPAKVTVDVHKILSNATARLGLIMQERDVKLEVNLQASQHLIAGNEENLETALINVLDNAIKYSNHSSRILMSTSNEGNNICISISDNGIGFDPAIKELIFEKFFRAHTGNIHNVKGYGIGLSFVKSVVANHNGRIKVNSAPGKGSTFVIILPSIKNPDEHTGSIG